MGNPETKVHQPVESETVALGCGSGDQLKQHIFTSVKVMKILGEQGSYTVLFENAPSHSRDTQAVGNRL